MKKLTALFGALTLTAVSVYGGKRYEQHKTTTAPYFIEKQEDAYIFVDKEKQRAFPAENIAPTYDKLTEVRQAVEDYKKNLHQNTKSLDEVVQ